MRARGVRAGQHAQARFLPQLHRRAFAAAVLRHVEPKEEAAGRALVAVAIADDLVGEIELRFVERTILVDMRLIFISCGSRVLQRFRNLRRSAARISSDT